MAAVLVSYDLNSPGQSYDKLIAQIKTYPGYCKVLKSAWIVDWSAASAQSVYEDLKSVIDENDHIFCVEINGAARQGWLPESRWDWIRANVGS